MHGRQGPTRLELFHLRQEANPKRTARLCGCLAGMNTDSGGFVAVQLWDFMMPETMRTGVGNTSNPRPSRPVCQLLALTNQTMLKKMVHGRQS
jgi:hypothetical protein